MRRRPLPPDLQRLRAHPKFWTVVRSARALATFPIVAICAIFIVEFAAGRLDTLREQLPTLVIGLCAASSATSMLYTVVALQRIRRELGYRGELWASAELRQLFRDVVG